MIKEDWAINTLVVYSVCVMDDDGELPAGDVRLSAVDVRRILTKKMRFVLHGKCVKRVTPCV